MARKPSITFSMNDDLKRRVRNAALYAGLEEGDFVREVVQVSLDMMDEARGAPIPDASEEGVKVVQDLMRKRIRS